MADDAAKALRIYRETRRARGLVPVRTSRGRSREVALRSDSAQRGFTSRYRRKLSPPKGNRARFGFPGGDKKARSDHGVLCFASARRVNHCARTDEIECATSFWSALRSASSEHHRISVCARVFHRKQGFQRLTMKPDFIGQSISILSRRNYEKIGESSKLPRNILSRSWSRRRTCAE